jgi:two-component system cell cycle sensor histidine kinase/response regulator CckA
MTRSYDAIYVILSIIVAMLASFAALDLAGRVRTQAGAKRLGWIAGGAAVMGLGIWSMHFIGMLAFHLPVPIAYDVPLMVLSMLFAIAASLLALVVISGRTLGVATLAPAGVLMGGAIAGMHYIGMASMRMEASRSYAIPVVAESVLIAIVASLAALWLAFRFRSDVTRRGTLLKMCSAVIMGVAISGMHYTGMAAAHFAPGHGGPAADSGRYVLGSEQFGAVAVVSAIAIILLALIAAVIDRNKQAATGFTLRLGENAKQLRESEQQYRLLFEHNPNPMWVYDDSTREFLAVNDAAIKRYGYSREEFLSMTRHDIRVEQGGGVSRGVKTPTRSADPADGWNGRHVKKDGSVIDVAVTSHAIVFDGRQACLALALDVTDQRRAEEALRQSEERTRVIIDNALDAVVSMNSAGVITDWSAQAERMFGWSRAEAQGRQMSHTIIPPRYRDAHDRGLKKFLETGEGPVLNKRIEITALNREGQEFPVELAISPAKLGGIWSFSAFIRDLTEQKKGELALKAGEQRYRELFEDIPIGLYRSTPEGQFIDVNPALVAMLGYWNRETLLGTPATSLYVDPADRRRWSSQKPGEVRVLDLDVRLRRADGKVIWVKDTTHVKRGPDGQALLYEGVLEDITDRVEAEHALQANERRLTQILEAAPLGIFVSDAAGTPVFVNAAAQRMLGVGVVLGGGIAGFAKAYSVYLAGTDRLYPVDRMPLVRALKGETTAVDDMEIREGGRVTSLNVQGAPVLDQQGKVVAAVAAFSDTTEKRSLEAQLRQSSKMEAVGQLAGGVAHDFNNLLTVIMSYSAMLLERLDPGDCNREDVQEIAAAADRAAGLTRQLLAFSRQQVLQPRVMSINDVIVDLEKMLRRLIGEDVQLATSLEAGLTEINADPGQLEQLVMNLVVNARDAMPEGGRLSITTSNSTLSAESANGALQPPEGDYVVLAVSDTGMGMTPEVQQRIFDPFFTTKDQGRGTGLGLSTVYGIVKQSGGEIYVYSEVGVGSTFKVYFPRFATAVEERQPEVKSSDVPEVPKGSEAVLVVEDDSNLRGLVARVLRHCGYTVYVASGGAEALAIAADREKCLDAVITDVVMPGMNGRELVAKLVESRPGIGFLFMSGYTDDDVLRRGVLHGETAFLQKPFTPDQLARKVRAVLDRAILPAVA